MAWKIITGNNSEQRMLATRDARRNIATASVGMTGSAVSATSHTAELLRAIRKYGTGRKRNR